MKKELALVCIALCGLGGSAAAEFNNREEHGVLQTFAREARDIGNDEILKRVYHNYLCRNMPYSFVDDFYAATEDDIELGLQCLGIGDWESGWSQFTSKKRNRDGSVDIGPLQLNSANIKDKKFMRAFSPAELHVENENVRYMVICINYFKDIKKSFGKNLRASLQAYNGGYRAPSSTPHSRAYTATIKYARNVQRKIIERTNDFNKFQEANWLFARIEIERDKYDTLVREWNEATAMRLSMEQDKARGVISFAGKCLAWSENMLLLAQSQALAIIGVFKDGTALADAPSRAYSSLLNFNCG